MSGDAKAGALRQELEALRFWLLVFVNVPPFPFSSWTNAHWGTISGPRKGDTGVSTEQSFRLSIFQSRKENKINNVDFLVVAADAAVMTQLQFSAMPE